jgi:hypothetical protein
MTKQRNKFLNFWFSLLPGFGQMFLGFMKRGLTLMFYFAASLAISIATELLVFLIPMVITCVYSFFDAINLNGMPPEKFAEIEDGYLVPSKIGAINNRKVAKYTGIAMILIGLLAVWAQLSDYLLGNLYEANYALYSLLYNVNRAIPMVAVCVIMIIVGVKLIRGKKKEVDQQDA